MNDDKYPKLRAFLRSMTVAEQISFAVSCGTTQGYLRKFLVRGGEMDAGMVTQIVTATAGRVPASELRPDVDWESLALHIGEHALVPGALPPPKGPLRPLRNKARRTTDTDDSLVGAS